MMSFFLPLLAEGHLPVAVMVILLFLAALVLVPRQRRINVAESDQAETIPNWTPPLVLEPQDLSTTTTTTTTKPIPIPGRNLLDPARNIRKGSHSTLRDPVTDSTSTSPSPCSSYLSPTPQSHTSNSSTTTTTTNTTTTAATGSAGTGANPDPNASPNPFLDPAGSLTSLAAVPTLFPWRSSSFSLGLHHHLARRYSNGNANGNAAAGLPVPVPDDSVLARRGSWCNRRWSSDESGAGGGGGGAGGGGGGSERGSICSGRSGGSGGRSGSYAESVLLVGVGGQF